MFPLQGKLNCGTETLEAASLAKLCSPDGANVCDQLQAEVSQRQAELLKKTEIATGCKADIAAVSLHKVWYGKEANAKSTAAKLAKSLNSGYSHLRDKISAPSGSHADPKALAKWYVVPGSASGRGAETPADKALANAAGPAGFLQCRE